MLLSKATCKELTDPWHHVCKLYTGLRCSHVESLWVLAETDHCWPRLFAGNSDPKEEQTMGLTEVR